ncbi:unnamed protein product [Enterobius vermicularis]|uniref:HEPN domain-containing protein n=1 Tax=Enterobius vermicularis TaxID=51028 RepID=A0A0N4VCU1_ENTVE|nr:unnamed protein product [Enterobius vermicularis]
MIILFLSNIAVLIKKIKIELMKKTKLGPRYYFDECTYDEVVMDRLAPEEMAHVEELVEKIDRLYTTIYDIG